VNARERYVRELERRLPFALGLRRRVISEVREHLHEGGDEALARFGPLEEVATQLARELRIRAIARASWLLPAIVAAFVFPFYVLPENTLPRAPWDAKPEYLAWKQHVALGALLVAFALALLAFVAARVRPMLASIPLAGSLAALAVAVAFGSVVAVQWIDAVPGTSATITYAGVAWSVLLLAAAALVVMDAFRLALPDRGDELTAD
jgi:hypothetical protein